MTFPLAGPAVPFVAAGTACVVAGGLVAAATAPAPSEHGSWAAAYLVLVAGVTQVALGLGRVLLAPAPAPGRTVAGEFAAWNAGNAAVLTGTLTGVAPAVDAGGALLVVAPALWLVAVHGARPRTRWVLPAYRALAGLILVSIPVGLVLAQVRG